MDWNSAPADVRERINRFAANYLRQEYRAYPLDRKVRSAKIIHCSPWGTHRYHPWEIDLLDTPLIQRLRQIHQTAGCLLTFPSSTHSRFEHTLGVVHQSSRLFGSVRQRAHEDPDVSPSGLHLDESALRDIRTAALVHDCGHGPFSHTSEEIYSLCADMQLLLSTVDPPGPFAGKRPHEVLAALIVMSDPFGEYVDSLNRKYRAEITRDWVANAIIGQSTDPTRKYLTQVVNGPFDADKLDYIFRDSAYVGLPMAVDLDRLWYGVQVSDRTVNRDDTEQFERILALDHGAASPLEQIIFCKLMLFQTLYHHHKVRAVDSMVKGVVEYIQDYERSLNFGDAKDVTLKRATDFLWLTDETFFAIPYFTTDQRLHRMIHNIRYRRLLKRALVIARETLEEESLPAFDDIRRLARRSDLDRHKECRRIAAEIWDAAGQPCDKHEVWLDIPYPPSGKEAGFAFVRFPPEDPARGFDFKPLSDSFPAKAWADMYWQNKWRGHVFCPPEAVEKISRVAKEVIERTFKMKMKHLSLSLCHLR